MPRTLTDFRKEFPEYVDVPDDVLTKALAAKYPKEYGAQAVPPEGPAQDIVGRAKEHLVKEPRPGERSMFGEPELLAPLGKTVRRVGRVVLPGSVPSAVASGAMMVPGAGVPMALARVAGATGAAAGAEALFGRDPSKGAMEAGLEATVGSVAGGVGRGAYRVARAALDKTTEKVAAVVARSVPEFSGKTPQETVARVMSGEGMAALSKNYGAVMAGLFKKHGDPDIIVPSLSAVKGDMKASFGSASDLMKQIDSLQRSLRTQLGDVSRRADALSRLEILDQAEHELTAALRKTWPPEAHAALDFVNQKYAAGKELTRLFGGGHERMTPAQVKRMATPEGSLNVPELQATYASRKASLDRALGPEARALEEALRRGEANPLARDIPGKGAAVGGHVSPGSAVVYPKRLPHAPKLVGEGSASEFVARAGRFAGARGTGAGIEE